MKITLALHQSIPREPIGIFLIWLVHLSGMIGVTLGYEEWFISQTPLNLLLMGGLAAWFLPIRGRKFIGIASLLFALGMLVEWMGVQFGWFFGTYSYGENLGIKVGGVPLLIGMNWALLVIITGAIANSLTSRPGVRAFIGASLMLILDIFMEHSAPRFDFWMFEGGVVPLSNYLAWFAFALLFHYIFQSSKITCKRSIAWNIYLAQCFFFLYFYFQG